MMGTVSRIAVHPIKALDPAGPRQIAISDIGGLVHDRTHAIVDGDGEYVNGKRTDAVHRLRADYDLGRGTVSIGTPESPPRRFHIDREREALEACLAEHFGMDVSLEQASGGGLTDGMVYGNRSHSGPTIISAATLETVATWFDGIEADELRLRLRPNIVVTGVPAFWEDRLVGDGGETVRVGDVRLVGSHPISRCVVPSRDPWTGARYNGFRQILSERREQTLPDWAPEAQFDHFLKLMVGLRIPGGQSGEQLRIGDPVTLEDEV